MIRPTAYRWCGLALAFPPKPNRLPHPGQRVFRCYQCLRANSRRARARVGGVPALDPERQLTLFTFCTACIFFSSTPLDRLSTNVLQTFFLTTLDAMFNKIYFCRLSVNKSAVHCFRQQSRRCFLNTPRQVMLRSVSVLRAGWQLFRNCSTVWREETAGGFDFRCGETALVDIPP